MEKLTAEEARKRWESAAPGWAKWEPVFAAGFHDATERMLDLAGVRRGSRLLDLACGAGSQSFQAARRVGERGVVVASDISATMLHHVRERARQSGITNIETLECAAEELGSSARAFDAAVCRLGLMLFPDPARAATAVRRALVPGGKFAALVFTAPQNNPFMAESMNILLKCAGKAPPAPGTPGIFALGAPGQLQALMSASGFTDVVSAIARAPLTLASTADVLEMMRSAFGAYRAVIAELPDAGRAAAWSKVGEFVSRFETAGGWHTELEVVIAAGQAPGQA